MGIIEASEGHWWPIRDGDPRALALYLKHYSALHYRRRRNRKIAGPGEYMMLMTVDCKALWVWRKFIDKSGQKGVNCAVFRNEGDMLSSELIKEAVDLAWRRWPGERLYTYINARKVKSANPGYCYLMAGWERAGRTQGGLLIMEKRIGSE